MVIHQPGPGQPYVEPSILVKGQNLPVADGFTYLGSALQSGSHRRWNRLQNRESLCPLRKAAWYCLGAEGLSLETKLKIYRAVVIPTFLNACETWIVYRRQARKLTYLHLSCLRQIMKIRWQDKIPDTEVLSRANMPTVHTVLMSHKIKLAGHLARMPDDNIPKGLFHSEISTRKCSHGGQRKRFKDTLKTSLRAFDIDPATWEYAALDRFSSQNLIFRDADIAEAHSWGKKKESFFSERKSCSHCHHSSSFCLSHLWQALSCADCTFQPSPDTPKIESGCQWSSSLAMDTHRTEV